MSLPSSNTREPTSGRWGSALPSPRSLAATGNVGACPCGQLAGVAFADRTELRGLMSRSIGTPVMAPSLQTIMMLTGVGGASAVSAMLGGSSSLCRSPGGCGTVGVVQGQQFPVCARVPCRRAPRSGGTARGGRSRHGRWRLPTCRAISASWGCVRPAARRRAASAPDRARAARQGSARHVWGRVRGRGAGRRGWRRGRARRRLSVCVVPCGRSGSE